MEIPIFLFLGIILGLTKIVFHGFFQGICSWKTWWIKMSVVKPIWHYIEIESLPMLATYKPVMFLSEGNCWANWH